MKGGRQVSTAFLPGPTRVQNKERNPPEAQPDLHATSSAFVFSPLRLAPITAGRDPVVNGSPSDSITETAGAPAGIGPAATLAQEHSGRSPSSGNDTQTPRVLRFKPVVVRLLRVRDQGTSGTLFLHCHELFSSTGKMWNSGKMGGDQLHSYGEEFPSVFCEAKLRLLSGPCAGTSDGNACFSVRGAENQPRLWVVGRQLRVPGKLGKIGKYAQSSAVGGQLRAPGNLGKIGK